MIKKYFEKAFKLKKYLQSIFLFFCKICNRLRRMVEILKRRREPHDEEFKIPLKSDLERRER